MNNHSRPAVQRGSALIVGLIMLMLMMILAITSIDLGKSSLLIVGNMQSRNQAVAAANSAIEDAISTTRMFKAPTAVYLNPCTTANTKCVDVNADGTNDITVALTPAPTCIKAQAIPLGQLNLALPENRGCTKSLDPGSSGIELTEATASLCSNTMWDVTAVAVDNVTSTTVTVKEGINVQVATNDIATNCPAVVIP